MNLDNTCPPTCPVCGDHSPVTIRRLLPNGYSVWRRDGALDTLIGNLPELTKPERHRRALRMLRYGGVEA